MDKYSMPTDASEALHDQVGWDTVVACAAIVFASCVRVPRVPPSYVALALGLISSTMMEPGFGFRGEIFFYLMLPLIILRSGLSSSSTSAPWRTTLLFSIFGTVFSALVIFVGCFVYSDLGVAQCAHIGSVLSSTDPVATTSALHQLPQTSSLSVHVKAVLENEALTNDAMAVMLSHASYQKHWSTSNTVMEIAIGVLISLTVGATGGYVFGGFSNPITVLGSATILFALCELTNASGILCIFVFAVCSRWRQTSEALCTFVNILSEIADLYCMFAVGTEAAFIDMKSFVVALHVFVACLCSRIVFVVLLGKAAWEGWKMQDLIVMGLSGARGTLSYALARSMGTGIGPIVLCVVILSSVFTTVVLFVFD